MESCQITREEVSDQDSPMSSRGDQPFAASTISCSGLDLGRERLSSSLPKEFERTLLAEDWCDGVHRSTRTPLSYQPSTNIDPGEVDGTTKRERTRRQIRVLPQRAAQQEETHTLPSPADQQILPEKLESSISWRRARRQGTRAAWPKCCHRHSDV